MRKTVLLFVFLISTGLLTGPDMLLGKGGGRGGRGGGGGQEEPKEPSEPGETGGPDEGGGPDEMGGPEGEEREGGRGGGGGGRGGDRGGGGRGEKGGAGEMGGPDEGGGPDETGGPGGGDEEGGPGGQRPERSGQDRGSSRGKRPRPVYKDCVARAEKFVARKDYKNAAKEYNRALMPLPADDRRKVYVYERLGWLALKEGDVEAAQGYYLTAVYQAERLEMSDKTTVNAYRGAAYCFEKEGETASAAENYEKALKLTTSKSAKLEIAKKLQRLKAGAKKKTGQ